MKITTLSRPTVPEISEILLAARQFSSRGTPNRENRRLREAVAVAEVVAEADLPRTRRSEVAPSRAGGSHRAAFESQPLQAAVRLEKAGDPLPLSDAQVAIASAVGWRHAPIRDSLVACGAAEGEDLAAPECGDLDAVSTTLGPMGGVVVARGPHTLGRAQGTGRRTVFIGV